MQAVPAHETVPVSQLTRLLNNSVAQPAALLPCLHQLNAYNRLIEYYIALALHHIITQQYDSIQASSWHCKQVKQQHTIQ